MAYHVKILQGDRLIRAVYAAPALQLVKDTQPLLREIHARLSPYGLHLDDIQIVTGEGALGRAHLLFRLQSAFLRAFVGYAEVGTEGTLAGEQDTLAQTALGGLERGVDGLKFDQYEVRMNMHARLVQGGLGSFLREFVRFPEGLGSPAGAGVVFYREATGANLSSSVTLDVSVRFEDAFFLSLQCNVDGQQITSDKLVEHLKREADRVYEALDIEFVE